ncbi:MAG: YccF protein [Conexibacter sp.]|nr:YccF protein [Conexibacter sp.]
MRLILNVIWLVLCGFWMSILWALAGVVMCLLIITIPFGLQAFKIANYVLWPFGRTIVKRHDAGAASLIGNVIWIVLVGWELAIGHLAAAILLAITIIGLPLAAANLKLIPISLVPFGREIVPTRAEGIAA